MWGRRTPARLPGCPQGSPSTHSARTGRLQLPEGRHRSPRGTGERRFRFPSAKRYTCKLNSSLRSRKAATLPTPGQNCEREGQTNARPVAHHRAAPFLLPPRDQAPPPAPSPRLASSVSRSGISMDPRDMMATPLSAEPRARNGRRARTSPHKHRLTRTCSGKGTGGGGGTAPPLRRNEPIAATHEPRGPAGARA